MWKLLSKCLLNDVTSLIKILSCFSKSRGGPLFWESNNHLFIFIFPELNETLEKSCGQHQINALLITSVMHVILLSHFHTESLLMFPNRNQRNTQELLSKAKRKVLLLQKGAATDHSLICRAHWGGGWGESAQFLSLMLSLSHPELGLGSQSLWLAIVWDKGKVFWHSDILQLNESDYSWYTAQWERFLKVPCRLGWVWVGGRLTFALT
jgi:hypothetical protein